MRATLEGDDARGGDGRRGGADGCRRRAAPGGLWVCNGGCTMRSTTWPCREEREGEPAARRSGGQSGGSSCCLGSVGSSESIAFEAVQRDWLRAAVGKYSRHRPHWHKKSNMYVDHRAPSFGCVTCVGCGGPRPRRATDAHTPRFMTHRIQLLCLDSNLDDMRDAPRSPPPAPPRSCRAAQLAQLLQK